MKLFLDSSALTKRFIAEAGSDLLPAEFARASRLGLSLLALTEVISALCRRVREGRLPETVYALAKAELLAFTQGCEIIDLGNSVLARAVWLLEHRRLRSADALQIACAVEWGAERFASADRAQCLAAAGLGMDIVEIA